MSVVVVHPRVPPSLSPSRRAQIKAARALVFMVGLNTSFAVGYDLLQQLGATKINWSMIGLFALGTLLYSILDVGEKYFSARGQMTIAEIFQIGKQEGMAYLHLSGETTNPVLEQVVTSEVQAVVSEEKKEEHDDESPHASA